MENPKTLKTNEEEFKIEEIISITSEKCLKDVNSAQVRQKLYESLKSSTEYTYDENKSLSENIYAAFPEYKLKELTEEYLAKMNSWNNLDLSFIDKTMHLKFAASRFMIPHVLTIKIKNDKANRNTKAKTNKNEIGLKSYSSTFFKRMLE